MSVDDEEGDGEVLGPGILSAEEIAEVERYDAFFRPFDAWRFRVARDSRI